MRALMDATELLAQVVEVSGDAIFTEDLTGRITTWNAAAERLYGCPAHEMVGRTTADLLPASTAEQLQQVRRRALSGERVDRFDSWHARSDGRSIAVSVTVSPLRRASGDVYALVTSVQDITERVHLRAQLEEAHRAMEAQNDALRRSNRDLQQFAYVASHDLSEPLRVMTGYVQLLEKRYVDQLDDKAARWIQHVVDGSARMRTLIDDLLEYSRFLRTDRDPVPVDLDEAAKAAAAGISRRSPDADVRVDPLPPVVADRASVESLLANLIGNGVKFVRPDTPATVHVSGERDRGMVRLVVDDAGIGIEPRYRERVFSMFQRLHAREDYAGTGIGLAIVQQVAELHGGRAWIEDSPLGGARVCVTLPGAADEPGVEEVPCSPPT
jgi:PAS domain S-box-containing protein